MTFSRNCFCERLTILELAFGSQQQYQDKCYEYLTNVLNYYYALPSYGIIVAMVNWALKKLVEIATLWMRFKDTTSEAKFTLTLVYMLQFLAMAIPQLIVNFDFRETSWVLKV